MRTTAGRFGNQGYSWRGDLRLVILTLRWCSGSSQSPTTTEAWIPPARAAPLNGCSPSPMEGDDLVRRTVYVPIYSSLSLGLDMKPTMLQLMSPLSIRSQSPPSARDRVRPLLRLPWTCGEGPSCTAR